MTTTAQQTAARDQYTAATTDAATRMAALIARHDAQTVPSVDPWLRRQLADLAVALLAGKTRLCRHIGASPMVCHVALWDRWHLVCSACIHDLIPGTTEDSTCDRCRRPAEPIHPGVIGAGPVLVTFGLCTRCAHRTGQTRR